MRHGRHGQEVRMRYRRIWILGGTAAGKTTLAKKISEKLGISHYSIDDFSYKKKWTEKYSKEDRVKNLEKASKKASWVIEGFHSDDWILSSMKRADVVVFLDMHKIRTLIRTVGRQIDRKREGKSGAGLKDFFDLLRWHAKSTSGKYRKYDCEGVNFIALKRPKEVEEFLDKLR